MIQSDIEYSHTSSELKGLSPLLKEWISTVKEYYKISGGDLCWLYNERASLSTLAGAAWKIGWGALEEYSTKKLYFKKGADKSHATGRCDLWIAHNSKSFAIEAKHSWQRIGSGVKTPNKGAKRKFQAAFKDAGRLQKNEADARLAVLFVAPSFPRSQLPPGETERAEKATEVINEWIATIKTDFGYEAVAYVFPAATRTCEYDGRIYPGVALIAKQRLKATAMSSPR